jgi:flavin-dependent dehydrogenase
MAEANVREACWPVPEGLAGAAWRGTPALTRSAGAVAGRRLFVVGDAAGYVEPFTGEGMAWAMESALRLGPIAAEASRGWRPELIARWKAEHRRVVTGRQFACRALAFVLRWPWLTAALVGALSLFPMLARPVLRSLGSPGLEAS